MKILGLVVTLGVLGYLLYLFFKKDVSGNGPSNGGGGGYTGVNDNVAGERPKDSIE